MGGQDSRIQAETAVCWDHVGSFFGLGHLFFALGWFLSASCTFFAHVGRFFRALGRSGLDFGWSGAGFGAFKTEFVDDFLSCLVDCVDIGHELDIVGFSCSINAPAAMEQHINKQALRFGLPLRGTLFHGSQRAIFHTMVQCAQYHCLCPVLLSLTAVQS